MNNNSKNHNHTVEKAKARVRAAQKALDDAEEMRDHAVHVQLADLRRRVLYKKPRV